MVLDSLFPMVAEQHSETDVGIEEAPYEVDVDIEWPIIDRFVKQVRALYEALERLHTNEDAIPPDGVVQKNPCIFQITFPAQESDAIPPQYQLRYFDASSTTRGVARSIYFFDREGNVILADIVMSAEDSGKMSTFRFSLIEDTSEASLAKKLTTVEVNVAGEIRKVRAFISNRIVNEEQPLTETVTILSGTCKFLEPFVAVMTSEHDNKQTGK